MVQVEQVKTKKQLRQFVHFPNELYRDCEYYVPMINLDEKNNFIPKKNPAFEECDVALFLAKRDGKIVGRIAGIIQHSYNKKMGCKKVRFSRFDSIDDQEVANALFNTVSEWAKSKGMTEIVGPLGFNDLDREGLLIEGFDRLSTYETQYSYPYYPKLIENYGFTKDVDWVEYRVKWTNKLDERYDRIGQMVLNKYNLKVIKGLNKKQLIKKYGDAIFDLIDEGYKDLYGTVPYSPKTRKLILKNFDLALNVKLMCLVVDSNDKPVAYALILPSLAEAVRDCRGKLLTFKVFKILRAIKNPKVVDFALVSIASDYHNKGLNGIIFSELVNSMSVYDIEACETNLNLEDNLAVQNMWHNLEREQHKRRRSYIKQIN